MRARRRYFLLSLATAVLVSIVCPAAVQSGTAVAGGCPASTSWDNLLQRCV